MREAGIRLFLGLVLVCAACARADNGNGSPDAGDTTTTEQPDGSSGPTDGTFTITTIANAVTNSASLHSVEVDNATVVAAHSYVSGSATVGTFYIQDGSGPGLAVYHGKSDLDAFPAVGDLVTVKGHLSHYSGSLQISSSTKWATKLSITIVTPGGGTVPLPVTGLNASDYASTGDAHADQVGHVLQFNGPLTVTTANAIVSTDTDGGTKPQGYEVTGGLIVDDNMVYHDCIKTLDGGVAGIDMSHGVRGVWDGYQDYNAGTKTNPAPTVQVLYPMTCGDLTPAQ